MNLIKSKIEGLFILEPNIFHDERGYFCETWNKKTFSDLLNFDINFVQDNHSFSKKNVLRGLHYQINKPQGKLLRVLNGSINDLLVDIRKNSKTFKTSMKVNLSSTNHKMLWIPAGVAHGFHVISEEAHVLYKVTEFYYPELERCLFWKPNDISFEWKDIKNPILSEKDKKGTNFRDTEFF